ncbi:MAG: S8 family peptidase, partial [Acidobacteriota bacterium]|nr:S8 family peptidase [Acidobacteriota bacterium]MDQ5872132.1 S8 family peptidase [Acidobacteriota bacterium]
MKTDLQFSGPEAGLRKSLIWRGLGVASLVLVSLAGNGSHSRSASEVRPPASGRIVIVQARDLASAAAAVRAAGGKLVHELGIINAVAAELTPAQVTQLSQSNAVSRIDENHQVEVAGALETYYPTIIGADLLHVAGIDGSGVTVAVLDTGMWKPSSLAKDTNGKNRVLAQYDVIRERLNPGEYSDNKYDSNINDGSGHGTHVTSIILSSEETNLGKFNGVAPNTRLVSVKAFDAGGSGFYADVIKGLDWIVANKTRFGIRVVNLSFSAPPRSHYWDDPLNKAVMRVWQEGIVVVASAGNRGPGPMTIGVPGNVPYVITVGAATDNYTPALPTDDKLCSFSAAGPTVEGFLKPELIAPGGHNLATMHHDSEIAESHPEFRVVNDYYKMSGTSQAAAVVSGVVALMLEAQPTLTPDDVKCRLIAAARPAVTLTGTLAYSVFQQGAGLVNANAAVFGNAGGCANRGLDVSRDLTGIQHYGGPADRDPSGAFYVRNLDGYTWNGAYSGTGGYPWSDGYPW